MLQLGSTSQDHTPDGTPAGTISGRFGAEKTVHIGGDFIWSALRHRWPLILGLLGLTVGAAVVLTSLQAPRYSADAQLVVTPDPTMGDTTDRIRSLETLERRTVVATLAKMATTRETKSATADALSWPLEKIESYEIRAAVVTGTNLVRIEVVGPDPGSVARIANAAAKETAQKGHETYPVFLLRSITAATAPAKPFLPDPWRNYTVAAMVGLFIGLMTALTVEYLRFYHR